MIYDAFRGYKFPDREPCETETFPPKRKRTRERRMTLARAMTQAVEAGVTVGSATMNADGSITLTFGKPVQSVETSEDVRRLL
ncbi:hypothetical protein [Bradyrhizobium cajani]|uniref:Uncharacterized protein n=1 Tax=Bradyrhizobium cajani TaxID=1928661 RepID=A0A844TFG7_9BRAD|nr:hypothetical protein [Bradyrhizobium cajani]MCP3368285.1 hypothetical protein [Bradyrhizobium cajani]MVT77758.1 hypothetical protein [Bradyrhizobium cajani]